MNKKIKNKIQSQRTHINRGFDFLKDEPDFDFDIIITNPPYSLKTEFFKKSIRNRKTFLFSSSYTYS